MGTVQSGGKVNYFANGQGKANFFLATDSYKKSGDGGIERVVEYHRVQVDNRQYDDLDELVKEGNIIMVQGEIRSYTKDGIITKFTQAEKCSLMGNDMDLKK
jgi:single-stranded DNA-binding protein